MIVKDIATKFQSPRGDSMAATAALRQGYRGLALPVSVPSRGFDGCNADVREEAVRYLGEYEFQSPRGDSMVATFYDDEDEGTRANSFSPLAGIRWLQR